MSTHVEATSSSSSFTGVEALCCSDVKICKAATKSHKGRRQMDDE
jgi:hypothetical protein